MPKPGQIITVAGNYRQYDQAREKTASGLRWENIGEIRPIAMPELECEPLAAALKDKTRFSRAEWAEFGIEETLTYRHYIQSGPVFFKPVEGDEASNASDDHGETQPVRCSPSPPRVQLTHTGAHWRTPGNDSARNTDPSERGTRPDDVHREDDQPSSREQGDRPSASDDGSDAGKSSPYRPMPSTSHTQKRPPPSQYFWATPGPIRIGENRFGRAFPSHSLFCSERTEEVPLRD